MKRTLRKTADGSYTLYVEELDETYHSTHGAVQEAMHVFIRNGLEFVQERERKQIQILEMGFGTGLNAWLTAIQDQVPVVYTGIEAYPVDVSTLEALNYGTDAAEKDQLVFRQIAQTKWNTMQEITPAFHLKKLHIPLAEVNLPNACFDLVYYDAFGPRAQSELWELEPLRKIVESMKVGGVFVTYCAQGQFKRNLKALGMQVESLPGPPGKREMTRAIKL